MKLPQKFYYDVDVGSGYYFFELQRILAVSRRTVYRLLKFCNIKHNSFKVGNRKFKKFRLAELHEIAKTKTFYNYIDKLKSIEAHAFYASEYNKTIQDEYLKQPLSKINLMLITPNQLVTDKLINLSKLELQNAVFSGLIPTFMVNDKVYVDPDYVKELKSIKTIK